MPLKGKPRIKVASTHSEISRGEGDKQTSLPKSALTEKNFFAALRYDLRLVALLTIGVGALWTIAVSAPLLAPRSLAAWFALGGLAAGGLPGVAAARRQLWSPWVGVSAPLGPALAISGVLWSTYITRRHGVRWRGRNYPTP